MKRLRRAATGQSGGSGIEFALLAALFLGLVFGTIQLAQFYLAGTVAKAAANVAYEQARADNGTAAGGQAAGYGYVSSHGGLSNVSIAVTRTPTTVQVTVSGNSPSLVPFLPPPGVEQTASGPTERWVGAP